jgi:hypothetical protein
MTYTEIEIDGAPYIRRDNEDGSSTFIVVDEANSDYQEYLKSLEQSTEIL